MLIRALLLIPLFAVGPALAADGANSDGPPPPIHIPLLPGELGVTLYEHDAANGPNRLPCLTFVSEGLARHGQAEVQFTVLRRADDDLPAIARNINGLLVALLEQAKAGNVVGPGGITQLDPGTALLGRADFSGVVYAPAVDNLGLPYRPDRLQALLLTTREVESARAEGSLRVLTLLTEQSRHFPWPPWIDRGRPALALGESVVRRVRALHLPDGWAFVEDRANPGADGAPSILTLSLGPRSLAELRVNRKKLGDAFALLPAPRADTPGLVAWTKGNRVHLQPGGVPAGQYDQAMVLIATAEGPDRLGFHEDGVVLVLGEAAAPQFWTAIAAGSPARIALSDGNVLVVSPPPTAE